MSIITNTPITSIPVSEHSCVLLVFKYEYLNFRHKIRIYTHTRIQCIHIFYVETLKIFLVKGQKKKNVHSYRGNNVIILVSRH